MELVDKYHNIYNQNNLCRWTKGLTQSVKSQSFRSFIKTPVKDDYIYTKETNQLFWYFLMIKNNDKNFLSDVSSKFKQESDEKIAIIEYSREKKSILKQFKITSKNFENDLLYEGTIPVSNFVSLCYLYNIFVVIVYKKMVAIINPKEGETPALVERTERDYRLKMSINQSEYDTIVDKYLIVRNLSKPFTSCSSYKLDELKKMVEKLGLPIEVKEKKQSLYDKLVEYIEVKM